MDATTVAMCNLDQIASETGFSEQALRQLMKEAFLRDGTEARMGEALLSGKVVPLTTHRQD
jgi:hypothetical protein